MSVKRPLWAVGEPEELAIAFTSRTEEQGKLLGRRSYMWLLAAIASGSVHNAVAQSAANDDGLFAQVRNIMLTAQAAERLIAATVPPELGDDDDDDGEAASSSSSTTSSLPDADDREHMSGSVCAVHVSPDETPLSCLQAVIQEFHFPADSWNTTATSTTNSRTATTTTTSPATAGAQGEPHSLPAAYSGLQQPPPPPSGHRYSVYHLAQPPPATCAGAAALLLLPDPALAAVISRLDGRSAAAAAAACSRLRAMRESVRFFDLPPSFRCYLASLLAVQDDFSDGSLESEFAASFPLDGSPVCGADLAEDAYTRRMAAKIPEMESLFELLSGPGGRSVEEFRSSLARTEQRRLPAPHPQSTPLAFFKQSAAVPFDCPASGGDGACASPQQQQQLQQPQRAHRHAQPQVPHHHYNHHNQQLQQQLPPQQQQPPPLMPPLQPPPPLQPQLLEAGPPLPPQRPRPMQHHQQQHWLLQPQPPPLPPVFSEPFPSTPPPTRPAIATPTPQRQLPTLTGVGLGAVAPAGAAAAPLPGLPGLSSSVGVIASPGVVPAPVPVGTATLLPPIPAPIAAAVAGGSGAGAGRDAVCCLANAMCDVQEVWDVPAGRLHCDGDLLAVAASAGAAWGSGGAGGGGGGTPAAPTRGGWTLSALTLGRTLYPQYDAAARYDIGAGRQQPSSSSPLPSSAAAATSPAAITRLCADSGNGLVWAASGEGGGIIWGFRAPVVGFGSPVPASVGCRRGGEYGSEYGGGALQYVLGCDVRGLGGSQVGLHALGTRLLCVKSSGALLSWDIPNLPQHTAAPPGDSRGRCGPEYGDPMDTDGDAASDEHEYDGVFFGDDDDDDMTEMRPQRRRRRDAAGSTAAGGCGGAAGWVGGVQGVRPHSIELLPVPSRRGSPSTASLLKSLSRDADFTAGGGGVDGPIRLTRLLQGAGASPPALVAALYGNIVVSYDVETQRVKQRLFGHLYDVTDIAAPPAAWRQSGLFATCARSGDVKLWDVRTSGGSSAMTLTGGETWQLNAVVLANASGGGGGQLGAGMVCFAGGEGESIWAWDLRGGQARPMYELSTGNTQVTSLAWHESGSSLFSSCVSRWAGARRGVACDPAQWKPVLAEADGGAGGGADGIIVGAGGAGYSSGGGSSSCSAAGGVGASGSSSAGGGGSGSGPGSVSTRCTFENTSPRSPGFAGLASDGGGGGGGSSGGGGRRLFWPVQAKHQPGDFGSFFSLARSCVLRYRFSHQAGRGVPRSLPPQF